MTSGLLFSHALLDGSGLLICRPSDRKTQQHYYSGCERAHVLRILGMIGLSGLFIRVFGTFPGSASDEAIFNMEVLDEQLENLHDWATEYFEMERRPTVASDGGFSSTRDMVTPFSFDPFSGPYTVESIYNVLHSRMRVPNEWAFGRCVNLFQTLQCRHRLKACWTKPECLYIVGKSCCYLRRLANARIFRICSSKRRIFFVLDRFKLIKENKTFMFMTLCSTEVREIERTMIYFFSSNMASNYC
jgi:hypothetical protein